VAEMKAMKLEDLLPPDSYSTAGAVLAEELQAERREPGRPRERSLELKHYAQDGSVRWVEVSVTLLRDRENRPSGLLGVTRNIAERKEAEEALRESETKLRGLLENLPDVVAMADRDSVIRFVNHGAPGASRQALLGSSGFDLLLPEYAQRCREAFQRTFAGHQPETLDARDVFGYWWTYRIVPMIEEGEVRNVMAICTDITEQRKAVEAVEKEQRLLRRLLDLQERDRQLIAYEIHDGFAQQLTGAKLNFEASARLRDRDPDQARKTFDAGIRLLGQGVAEARRLISGLRPPVLDEFGVLEAVHYLTCEAQDHGGPEVEFHQDVQFERLAAPLESAVFRIVQESLANACRHSQSPRIRIELVQRDDRVQLSVRDWGIGFNPAEVEEHCFGLKGIRERARLLGGKATIDTVIDQGTCITVDLPLVEPSQKGTDSEGPPSESPAPPPRHGPGRSPRNT
jgi:PAS domain S-box-containing protein